MNSKETTDIMNITNFITIKQIPSNLYVYIMTFIDNVET